MKFESYLVRILPDIVKIAWDVRTIKINEGYSVEKLLDQGGID